MKALVLSVPGTGSRFTMNFLMGALGYEKIAPIDLVHKPAHSPFCSLMHINASNQNLKMLYELKEKLRTIIPLRAPVHQFLTRVGEQSHAMRVREESKSLWNRLIEMKEKFDYVYLPIEEDFDRAKRLMIVANHLQAVPDEDVFAELVTHWPKVGSSGVKPVRVRYNKDGDVNVGGFNMSFLDNEMAWYRRTIEEYAKGL